MYVTKINSSNLELYRASGYGATCAKLASSIVDYKVDGNYMVMLTGTTLKHYNASSRNTTTLSTNTLSFDFKGDRFAFIDCNNKLYVKDGLNSTWVDDNISNVTEVNVTTFN